MDARRAEDCRDAGRRRSPMEQIAEPFPETIALATSTPARRDWTPFAILGVWACGFAGDRADPVSRLAAYPGRCARERPH